MSFIPYSEIKEGFLKCLKHSQRLIAGAEELQDQNEFANAVPLVIIAQEELGKAVFLLKHVKSRKNISYDEWEKYSKGKKAHINKLREFREFVKKLPRKKQYRFDADSLQEFKELGFYVDRKDGKWYVYDESDLVIRVGFLASTFVLINEAVVVWSILDKETKSIDQDSALVTEFDRSSRKT
jgi:AbiV family abortive infection protein